MIMKWISTAILVFLSSTVASREKYSCQLLKADDNTRPRESVTLFTNAQDPNSPSFKIMAVRFEPEEMNVGLVEPFMKEAVLFTECVTRETTDENSPFDVKIGKGWISAYCYNNGEIRATNIPPPSHSQKLETANVTYYREDSSWVIEKRFASLSYDGESLIGLSLVGTDSGDYVCY